MTDMGTDNVSETTESKAGGRRRWILPVLAVAVLAGGVFGVRWIRYRSTHESTNDAYLGGSLVPVLTRVGGFIEDVRVIENQVIRRGDTLVVLDDAELVQRVHQAEADLAAARAASGTAGMTGQAAARIEQATRQREALTAQIAAAHAEAERADRDLERVRGLAEKEIVSRQRLDQATAAAAAAHAAVTGLEEQRGAASAAVTTARAGAAEADARLAAAEAALESARLQLSYATVTAPTAGTVAKRSGEPGQLVQPGQPLLTIVADTVFVTANFKETQLAAIQPGNPVAIDVDAYDDCEVVGEVESIGGATGSQFALIPPDNATGNFTKVVQRVPVRIRVLQGCRDEQPLRPGMSVVVHVTTG